MENKFIVVNERTDRCDCKNLLQSTTIMINRQMNNRIVSFDNVRVDVCDKCDVTFIAEDTIKKIEALTMDKVLAYDFKLHTH